MRRNFLRFALLALALGAAFAKQAPAEATCTCSYCPSHPNAQCIDSQGQDWPCWAYASVNC